MIDFLFSLVDYISLHEYAFGLFFGLLLFFSIIKCIYDCFQVRVRRLNNNGSDNNNK